MKSRIAFVLALVCLLSPIVQGQNSPAQSKPAQPLVAAEEQKIIELEKSRLKALLSGDWRTMDKIWDEDLVVVTGKGDVRRKSHRIYALKNSMLKYQELTNSDVSVIMHGDTAVVTGLAKRKGQDGTNDLSGYFRFTRTWVKKDGEWKLALQHSTSIDKF